MRLLSYDLVYQNRTCSQGNTCRLYAPHNGLVSALAVSSDGRWIASGSRDVGIIWDARTRQPIHEWIMPVAHCPSADSFAFSPDSKYLAYDACIEGKPLIKIRNVEKGHKIAALQGCNFGDQAAGLLLQLTCAWLPDRLICVSLTRFRVVVQTWDAHTLSPKFIREYVAPFDHGSLLLSPDGRRLAGIAATTAALIPAANKRPADRPPPCRTSGQRSCSANHPRPHTARRAQAPAANYPLCVLWDLDADDPGEVLLSGQGCDQVLAASFDRDSERLVLSLTNHTIWVWNMTTRQLLSITEPTAREVPRGLPAYSYHRPWLQTVTPLEVLSKAATFTPDGRRLLSLRHTRSPEGRLEALLMAWDARSGVPLQGRDSILPPEVGRNLRLARFSPAGTHVALAANDGKVHVIDLLSIRLSKRWTFGAPEETPARLGLPLDCRDATRLVFSFDGHTLCWGTRGGEVEIRSF